MFSPVLWSEHCSYKHSRPPLEEAAYRGGACSRWPRGECWGGRWGGGYRDRLSDRVPQPSGVRRPPKKGAATGVGGMLRDIMSMGPVRQPCSFLVRFGPLEESRARWHFTEAVAGMSDYGNTVEVPTVGGEVYFAPTFSNNPCVMSCAWDSCRRSG